MATDGTNKVKKELNLCCMGTVESVFGNKVRVRVCGLCYDKDKILLVKHNMGSYFLWIPPVGGLKFGETLSAGLIREFKEETGLDVTPGELLFINEHIKLPYHAIELFYNIVHWEGELRKGIETEMTSKDIIEEVKFLSAEELNMLEQKDLHTILKNCTNPRDILAIRGLVK